MTSQIEVKRNKKHFTVEFRGLIKAPPERVRRLLTDFDHLDRLSKNIQQSKILGVLADGRIRVQVRMRGCLWFICRKVSKVEDVTILKNGDIVTVIIPELSDFKMGKTRWQIKPAKPGTLLIYTAELVPKMRGVLFFKRVLRREIIETVKQLEKLAGPIKTSAPVSSDSP